MKGIVTGTIIEISADSEHANEEMTWDSQATLSWWKSSPCDVLLYIFLHSCHINYPLWNPLIGSSYLPGILTPTLA